MADQKNRGGQKQGNQDAAQAEKHQGTGGRADQDKQSDQRNNPDDARRQPTDQQR